MFHMFALFLNAYSDLLGILLSYNGGVKAKVFPIKHLKKNYLVLMVAFSTSSSYSTLPLIISDAKDKMSVSNCDT